MIHAAIAGAMGVKATAMRHTSMPLQVSDEAAFRASMGNLEKGAFTVTNTASVVAAPHNQAEEAATFVSEPPAQENIATKGSTIPAGNDSTDNPRLLKLCSEAGAVALKTPVHEIEPARTLPAKHLPVKSAKLMAEPVATNATSIADDPKAVMTAVPVSFVATAIPLPVSQLESTLPVADAPLKPLKGTAPMAVAKGSVHEVKKAAVEPAASPAIKQVATSEHQVHPVQMGDKSDSPTAPLASLVKDGVGSVAATVPSNAPMATIKAATVTHSAAATSTVTNIPAEATDSKTLIATANVLEVGMPNGTHGWLRVRAELGQMGEVTASMVASSAGAADSLHHELPGLSAYLKSEAIGVTSLVVTPTQQSSGAQDAAMSFGAQAGMGERERGSQDQTTENAASRGTGNLRAVEGFDMTTGLVSLALPAAIYAGGSGSWLSVRV